MDKQFLSQFRPWL